MLTLEHLNQTARTDLEAAVRLLDGIYEHTSWVAREALAQAPLRTLAHLKYALAQVVREAGQDKQLGLIRAHPELAGKAAIAGELTAESTAEQAQAGLQHCTPQEFDTLQRLNSAYKERFGWPFILAVRGPRGQGLTRTEIITHFERRLDSHPDEEMQECLRQIHRIAELRLNERFGHEPTLGRQVWDWAEALAQHSDPGFKEQGQLTVTYLTEAHQRCSAQLQDWMRGCGFDTVSTDAVGNVVGVYWGQDEAQGQGGGRRLLTGSHFDTVRNGGRYDGRLGILVPMACVRELHRQGRRLPYGIEVVGFAEEEGQRYKATFLGSGALTGDFDPAWLDQRDAQGITMRQAMQAAGLPGTLEAIAAIRRDATRYLGFVEVHIEQGPVLHELDMPLGVVSSINGAVRYLGQVQGTACHAGTTPMDRRRDAAAAAAELVLFVERRAREDEGTVGTVGLLEVPGGSINVVPGLCRFSLDLRAPVDEQRDALAADVLEELADICQRRGVRFEVEESMRASAAPCDADLRERWGRAVAGLGLPVFELPSGAGHDAMKLHEVMPQAMLFMRGANGGISHNPLETITDDDADLCVQAFQHLLSDLTVMEPLEDDTE